LQQGNCKKQQAAPATQQAPANALAEPNNAATAAMDLTNTFFMMFSK
jgi:hypothetical protein